MTAVDPIVDGRYLRADTQQKALAAAEASLALNLAPAEQPETIPQIMSETPTSPQAGFAGSSPGWSSLPMAHEPRF